MILIVVFYAIMATVYTVGKQTVLYAAPFFLTAVRIAPAGALFLAYQRFRYGSLSLPKSKDWYQVVLYAFAVLIMDSGRLIGLQYIPSANAALLGTTSPFIAAFLCWWLFGEHITMLKLGALGLGVAGVMPLLSSHLQSGVGHQSSALFGYAMIGAVTVAFVTSGILSKILIHQKKYPFFTIVGLAMLGGGLLGLICSLLFDLWTPLPLQNVQKVVPLIGYLFVVHSCIAYPLYNYLVQKYPVTLVAFAQLMTPFFAAVFGWFLFSEPIGFLFFKCLGTLSIALVMFYYAELKEGLISD